MFWMRKKLKSFKKLSVSRNIIVYLQFNKQQREYRALHSMVGMVYDNK